MSRMACFLCPVLFMACSLGSVNESDWPDSYHDGDVQVLFIGNSLTFYNNMPQIVDGLSRAGGYGLFVDQSTVGGASLADHAGNPVTLSVIDERDWDYVVLQGSSYSVAFPEEHSLIQGAIRLLRDRVLANNPQTRVVFFMDWAMQDGVIWNQQYYSYEDFQQRVIDGTMILADSLDLIVAPIGCAWKTVVAERPDINLFYLDGAHPSSEGSYLEACVYFSLFFQAGSESFSYAAGLDNTAAAYLRRVASETVLNNWELWTR